MPTGTVRFARRSSFESDPTVTLPAASGHLTAAIDGDIAAGER
jgi:hypothetical protein